MASFSRGEVVDRDKFLVGSLNVWFSLFVFVSLFASSLYELKGLLLLNHVEDDVKREIKETLLYILLIAASAYAFISYSFISYGFETFETRNIRYLDWIVTTPLLTYTAYLFIVSRKEENGKNKNSSFDLNKLLTLNLLFVAFGIVGEYTKNSSFNLGLTLSLISFVFYGGYLFYLYKLFNTVKETRSIKCASEGKLSMRVFDSRRVFSEIHLIKAFFFIGWTLYGIVFAIDFLNLVDRKIIVLTYSCLDIINKIIYSFVLSSFI